MNLGSASDANGNYRNVIWTGKYLQSTLMSIEDEVGLERHPETDQILIVQEGRGVVKMGARKNRLDAMRRLGVGSAIFVPMGTWHNIINKGRGLLKLISIYSPPHHPPGLVQRHAREGDDDEEEEDSEEEEEDEEDGEYDEDDGDE
ncbi:MAG: cupin domain-containing protein [Candidatus Paceibacterota bacterium]